MEFANINDTMRLAKDQDKRFIPLFGSETFRSWILYFRPGEHTDMHFHISPETFLVLQGKASVKGLKDEERVIEQNETVFFGPKITIRSPTSAPNRSCSSATVSKRSAAPM